ncbi:COP9 signalosome subunit 6 [Laetiporus sulphureus 93-53]|uniref:COP9 signalosome complex subunit 6 n=1 Tax=Laetiporus sulphureus 93-53 TaxID=1314785 RepID=A0A165E6F5_9APHY|nr:COP9 signalosome subunit 6 [Laetiporus sulphureus 93-53]KZT06326.1 COP9 signalosome subunit 6 [Laetiporus sulphureus 93-53]
MTSMDVDELPVVLPSTTTSTLSLSLHPLPILNISEHLTRLKLQTKSNSPFVLGALLGTQNGREVEIVNTFELAVGEDGLTVDQAFLIDRKEQYKLVFPSLEFIGWYTVAPRPNIQHIALHEQFVPYSSTPLLVLLQPSTVFAASDITGQALPIKAYEPTFEIRDNKSRSVFIEAPFTVETGEAERIAVDWTAKGGEGDNSLESHLNSQRAAVKMLHDRIVLLVKYVSDVLAGQATKDHATLRSLSALVASLPASEHKGFREEFDTEYEDVQLTAYLAALTKSTSLLNDLIDKHNVLTATREERAPAGPRRRGMGMGMGMGLGGIGMMGMRPSDWGGFR